jgi:hypothetical protein
MPPVRAAAAANVRRVLATMPVNHKLTITRNMQKKDASKIKDVVEEQAPKVVRSPHSSATVRQRFQSSNRQAPSRHGTRVFGRGGMESNDFLTPMSPLYIHMLGNCQLGNCPLPVLLFVKELSVWRAAHTQRELPAHSVRVLSLSAGHGSCTL